MSHTAIKQDEMAFQTLPDTRKRKGKLVSKVITLAHGGGGKAMRDLIDDVFMFV